MTATSVIGWLRIVAWEGIAPSEDIAEHAMLVGTTVGLTVVAVVLWGTLTGAMLPLILRRLGWDPASASAPLVATLVDVTGLLIYFGIATALLTGTLL